MAQAVQRRSCLCSHAQQVTPNPSRHLTILRPQTGTERADDTTYDAVCAATRPRAPVLQATARRPTAASPAPAGDHRRAPAGASYAVDAPAAVQARARLVGDDVEGYQRAVDLPATDSERGALLGRPRVGGARGKERRQSPFVGEALVACVIRRKGSRCRASTWARSVPPQQQRRMSQPIRHHERSLNGPARRESTGGAAARAGWRRGGAATLLDESSEDRRGKEGWMGGAATLLEESSSKSPSSGTRSYSAKLPPDAVATRR